MKVERNTEGLRNNAQKKRQQAFEKVDQGIKQLVKDKQRINFNTVAKASGVSKAWLYKEPEVKARIEQLREQALGQKKLPPRQRASDASKDSLILTLRNRLKKSEQENVDLRRQNEVAFGFALKARELEKLVERLQAENRRLGAKGQVKATTQERPDISGIWDELLTLGVSRNLTLERLIEAAPSGIVEASIQTLKQSIEKTEVGNPGGFLNKAISEAWRPHENGDKSDLPPGFNEW